jgi:hypothetical protein
MFNVKLHAQEPAILTLPLLYEISPDLVLPPAIMENLVLENGFARQHQIGRKPVFTIQFT